jgi:hypothetical protein
MQMSDILNEAPVAGFPKRVQVFSMNFSDMLYPTPALPEAIVKNEQKRRSLQNNKGRKGMSIFASVGYNPQAQFGACVSLVAGFRSLRANLSEKTYEQEITEWKK